MFASANVIILDCETLHSAAELPTGWDDKRALGFSIGAYYDYQDMRVHWFDAHTLAATMGNLLARQPLIVSFNGIGFDGPLLAAVHAETLSQYGGPEEGFFHAWAALWARSYDILAEVWRAAGRDYTRGINSLDALCHANGLGRKTGIGTLAPILWGQGRIADVLEYCQHDVLLTQALLEHVSRSGGWLHRSTGPLHIRHLCYAPYLHEESTEDAPIPVLIADTCRWHCGNPSSHEKD